MSALARRRGGCGGGGEIGRVPLVFVDGWMDGWIGGWMDWWMGVRRYVVVVADGEMMRCG